MLHKAWNCKGEMPYCFPRSSIKFQGHTVQNITDFDPNWVFLDYRPVAAFKSLRFAFLTMFPSSFHHEIFRSYYQWQKWLPCKRSRSEVKGKGHRGHNPTSPFPDCNSSFNSHMMMKSCKWLDDTKERCHIVFQGHPSSFKVTGLKKSVEFDPEWAFPDCNSSLNSPMAMKWYTKLEVA